jgi:VIT1/CCC1 family predicted Fe2+/Mn2+ transporter
MPDVEQDELAQIYRAKGLPQADAERIAAHLMANPAQALDTKVREELGLDPDELGSSWGAAIWSFVAFTIGAAVPLIPFLLTSGQLAFVSALSLSLGSLFAVGAAVSLVTGRNMVFSGVRQVLIGAVAAAVTYGVGSLIGASAS